jgi:hypothetical protein
MKLLTSSRQWYENVLALERIGKYSVEKLKKAKSGEKLHVNL